MQLRGLVAGQSHGGICATTHTQDFGDECSNYSQQQRPRLVSGHRTRSRQWPGLRLSPGRQLQREKGDFWPPAPLCVCSSQRGIVRTWQTWLRPVPPKCPDEGGRLGRRRGRTPRGASAGWMVLFSKGENGPTRGNAECRGIMSAARWRDRGAMAGVGLWLSVQR